VRAILALPLFDSDFERVSLRILDSASRGIGTVIKERWAHYDGVVVWHIRIVSELSPFMIERLLYSGYVWSERLRGACSGTAGTSVTSTWGTTGDTISGVLPCTLSGFSAGLS